MEQEVIATESHALRTRLSEIRREAIMLRRYLSPQRDAMTRLPAESVPWLSDANRLHLKEATDRLVRCIEDLDSARDRAAVTQGELANRLSEQLNTRMYVLSLVAAVFLPLGFLTGLLGINLGGIPGSEKPLRVSGVPAHPRGCRRRADRHLQEEEVAVVNTVIANENANWGRSRSRLRTAMALLHDAGFPCSLAVSNSPGHAGELAAAAQNANTIVVAGGDGTLNEVANGLCASGRDPLPRIGIIPLGSSNDFSKSLGIPQSLREACHTVAAGTVRAVDIGRVGSHYFCSASCIGYFAEIAARSLHMKQFGGSLRYTIPALAVIREMASGWAMTVNTESGVFRGNYAVLLVGNAPRFGGLTMLPGARPDDGFFDCLLIEMAGKWEALHLIPLVYGKALDRHRRVTRFRTASLRVSLDRPSRLCLDGEVDSTVVQQLDYTVQPGKLPVICPAQQGSVA